MSASPQGSGLGRRLAGNAIAAAAGRVVVLAMWLLLTPPLLRHLGDEAFGVWSLFYALTFWLLSLDLGLASTALRHVAAARAAGRPDEGADHTTLAVLGYLVLGACWLALSPVMAGWAVEWLRIPPALDVATRWAVGTGAAVFAVAGLVQTSVALLQAHERFDLAAWGITATTLVQGAGVAFGLARGEGLAFLVTMVLVGWVAGLVVCVTLLRHGAPECRLAPPARAARRLRAMLAFGGAVQAANTVSVLHQQVDKALLARYAALAAVAPYEVGLRVASAAASFPQFLMVAIQPTATAMHARGDRGGLLALHQRTTRWAVACAALLCAALVGGAGPLLRAWLGRTDTDAVLALQGLALASLAASPAGVAGVVGRAIGRPGLELEWAVLALTLHLAVALPLLPGLGLRAVLLAMVTANTVSTLWFLSRLAPQLGWPVATALREALLVPAIATAAGAGLGLMLAARWPDAGGAWAWGGAVAVGATAAGATAALLAAMRYVDWREARSLLVGRSG